MYTVETKVAAALAALGAVYTRPTDELTLPRLSWRASGNSEAARADGREYLSRAEYTVDCWAKGPEELHALAERADEAMRGLHLKRVSAAEIYDTDAQALHRVLKYRGLIDKDGNVWQE